uniref:Putative secreted protein n=1 Tax=Anopheles darlingi TaxID=43151 RepID=A0A2M4D364_ANODA
MKLTCVLFPDRLLLLVQVSSSRHTVPLLVQPITCHHARSSLLLVRFRGRLLNLLNGIARRKTNRTIALRWLGVPGSNCLAIADLVLLDRRLLQLLLLLMLQHVAGVHRRGGCVQANVSWVMGLTLRRLQLIWCNSHRMLLCLS